MDPRYNRGKERLPLWALTLWKRLINITKQQEEWRDAYRFVLAAIKTPVVQEYYTSVESVFRKRGWNEDVRHGGNVFGSHKFAQLLRQVQLCDDITQTMIHTLQTRLQREQNTHPHHRIAASRFYTVLRMVSERKKLNKKDLPTSLKVVEDAVKSDPNIILWFPVLHRGHEVAICVDFGRETVSYGLSPRLCIFEYS
jgi:hypothetical protein